MLKTFIHVFRFYTRYLACELTFHWPVLPFRIAAYTLRFFKTTFPETAVFSTIVEQNVNTYVVIVFQILLQEKTGYQLMKEWRLKGVSRILFN